MLLLTCFLAILLPYVSLIYRFPSEVQPWAALLAWLVSFDLLLRGKFAKFRTSEWLILAISIYFFCYVYMDADFDLFFLKKSGAFFLSLGIYWVAARTQVHLLRRVLPLVVLTYFIFAVLQHVSVSYYVSIAAQLVPVRDVHVGERGAASLAPEAADFGFAAVYFIMLIIMLPTSDPRHTKVFRRNFLLFLVASSCVALSESGSGIIAGVIVTVLALPGVLGSIRWDKRFLLAIVVTTGLVLAFVFIPRSLVEEIRGLRLLYTAIEKPLELLETSFAHRFIHNVAGSLVLYDSYGFGFGGGSFVHVAPAVFYSYDLESVFDLNDWYSMTVPESMELQALGVLPLLMAEYGVIGLLLAVTVFGSVWKSMIPYKYAVLALLGMTWLQSFPASYPLFWLVAGLAHNPILKPCMSDYRKHDSGTIPSGPADTR